MTKTKKQSTQEISSEERFILITAAAIMGAFVLFVCIATNMSLAYYTVPHFVLTLATLAVVFFGARHRILARTVMTLSVIGSAVAVFLFLAYLPYYMQHIEYMNSLKK